MQIGKQSIRFVKPVFIMSSACVVGPKEGEGPLKDTFDEIVEDATFGKDTWEEGESEMMKQTVSLAIKKAKLKEALPKNLHYILYVLKCSLLRKEFTRLALSHFITSFIIWVTSMSLDPYIGDFVLFNLVEQYFP